MPFGLIQCRMGRKVSHARSCSGVHLWVQWKIIFDVLIRQNSCEAILYRIKETLFVRFCIYLVYQFEVFIQSSEAQKHLTYHLVHFVFVVRPWIIVSGVLICGYIREATLYTSTKPSKYKLQLTSVHDMTL